MIDLVLLATGAAAVVLSALRWLRVAQREHYLPGAVSRFAVRWWSGPAPNVLLGLVAVAGSVGAWVWRPAAIATAVAVAVGPRRLWIRGRTSKLAWTRRLRTLAAVDAVLLALVGLAAALFGAGAAGAAVAALLVPPVTDAALAAVLPLERALAQRHVDRAAATLRALDPVVVAITGSYGKTTTKGYVRHIAAAVKHVVASPASFNNRAGLSRAVNEQLTQGTDVFVAEMGTYGPGEIRELCGWVRPRIGVITAIGPVHLERMGSIEAIARAKAEILEGAEAAVVNVDAPHMAAVADEFARRGRVVRCSVDDPAADVVVRRAGDGFSIEVGGQELGVVTGVDAHASNIACAVGVAILLDVPHDVIVDRLRALPSPPNRLQVARSQRGVVVVDDTFNSNPDGARAALELLERHASKAGRRVVVTPGMVELGTMQYGENAAFAAAASKAATDVVIVGRTNRTALLEGARQGPATVHLAGSRDEAVAWVRANLGTGDVVLYENDLPDHYP